jgi:hypothetical protein
LAAPTVVEASYVLGALAALLLVMAVVAWVKLSRGPLLQRTAGRIGRDTAQGEFASQLLFWAAGLSSAAAFLAIGGWIFA